MPANPAWQRHGCYKLGSDQYFNMPLQKALTGCYDDWNSLDHFDPTTESRRMFAQFNYLRSYYASLRDGYELVQRGNWTHFEQLPGSNQTQTELGLWTVSRAGIPNSQVLTGNQTDQVWLLYSNENATRTWEFPCSGESWISSPYQGGVIIKNLFAPYETYTLENSGESFFDNGTAPFQGCLASVTMDPYSFKAFVPESEWIAVPPQLTKFNPGHDARLLNVPGDSNATTIDISLEFNVAMSCDSVTGALSLNVSSSGHGDTPKITNVQCGNLANPEPATVSGAGTSSWSWNATLTGVPDGIISLTLNNPTSQDGTASTGSKDHLLLRKGASNNVMVFPLEDYANDAFSFDSSQNQYTFNHSAIAIGAEMFRYSWNYGQNWTQWTTWEDSTSIDKSLFDNSDNWWEGEHIMVQCK